MKRFFSTFIFVSMLLILMTGTVLANDMFEMDLLNLEDQRDANLDSIKEQLEDQNMMEHYYIYKELVEIEYDALKENIENKYNLVDGNVPLAYRNNSSDFIEVRLRNGGQISYEMGKNITTDPRGHAFIASDYYTKYQTTEFINAYYRNKNQTLGDFGRYFSELALSAKYTKLAPILIGIEVSGKLKNYVTERYLDRVESSNTGCMIWSASSTVVGKSTAIREWEDVPYAYYHRNATRVKVEHF